MTEQSLGNATDRLRRAGWMVLMGFVAIMLFLQVVTLVRLAIALMVMEGAPGP